MKNDETSYVYIIAIKADDGSLVAPVKVGMSDSPKARLAQLLTGSHTDMAIVHAFAMPNRAIAGQIEQAFHKVKRAHRKRGEWFDIEPSHAVMFMCMNIDVAVETHARLEPEEMEAAWELIGWPYSDWPYRHGIFNSQ